MKGFVFVSNKAIDMDDDLESWIDMAMTFNKVAKKSKNKSGKK